MIRIFLAVVLVGGLSLQACRAQCIAPGEDLDRCAEHIDLMDLMPGACSSCTPDESGFWLTCDNNVFARPALLTWPKKYIYRRTSTTVASTGYDVATPSSLLCGTWGYCDPYCDSHMDGNVLVDRCIQTGGYNDELFYFTFSGSCDYESEYQDYYGP